MRSVKSFLQKIDQNYYLDFIVDPYSVDADYENHFVLVNYNNKEYYEKSLESIRIRQEEIINDVKKLYDDAVSQIYIKLSTSNPENYDTFITFNIEVAKKTLNKFRNDFFVDSKRSRYNSILIDNYDIRNIGKPTEENIIDSNFTKEDSLQKVLEKIKENKNLDKLNSVPSFYYLEHHLKRFKVLSYLPFYFYTITHSFIDELKKVKKMIEDIKDSNHVTQKMKWSGKKTHIGFILGRLALEGYIDPPRSINGEINYTAYAKLIKELFDVEVHVDTLRKYLNPDEEKFLENQNKFEKHKFSLPHVKEVT